MSRVIYDRRMPMRLKAQVYKTMVRPVGLYGAETWAVKHVKKLEVAEMKCLRAIRGVTTRERMRNEDISQVAELREKIRESRLRWVREEKRRGRVCQMVSGTQGDGNKEERATEKAMDGLCSR